MYMELQELNQAKGLLDELILKYPQSNYLLAQVATLQYNLQSML